MLARSGGSVWEIAAAGRPAILVPYPFATGDHQAKNAEYFARPAARSWCASSTCTPFPELIRSLLDDPERLAGMGEAMLAAARPNAADEIADELVALAGGAPAGWPFGTERL